MSALVVSRPVRPARRLPFGPMLVTYAEVVPRAGRWSPWAPFSLGFVVRKSFRVFLFSSLEHLMEGRKEGERGALKQNSEEENAIYINAIFTWKQVSRLFLDPPAVKLRLGSKLDADNIHTGHDVYFECDVRANPPHLRLEWTHNVSNEDRGVPCLPLIVALPFRAPFASDATARAPSVARVPRVKRGK